MRFFGGRHTDTSPKAIAATNATPAEATDVCPIISARSY